MGIHGPVPKRSSERRRRNKSDAPETRVDAQGDVAVPEPDPAWHPVAREWFAALLESAQIRFYEPSDWATAKYVAEAMSRSLTAGRFSGQLFSAVISSMTSLLVTEGDRRRFRVEVERRRAVDPDEDASVTTIAEWQSRMERYKDL